MSSKGKRLGTLERILYMEIQLKIRQVIILGITIIYMEEGEEFFKFDNRSPS